MLGRHEGRLLAMVFSAIVLVSMALPSAALAIESHVQVEDRTTADPDAQEISDLVIGDVDTPEAGKALDSTATVRSVEGHSWDVLVLWIDQDLQLSTTASEDGAYLPAIAFFVPETYRVQAADGAYFIRLSDELVKIFGTNEVVSVFDAASGITYILPAHLRDYFKLKIDLSANARQVDAESAQTSVDPSSEPERSIIDIFCSKSARDSFSDEDLEWFLDLVISKLQPEAINLLLEKFPAFNEAAAKGEIGTEIGLYVYYQKGDEDGFPEHSDAPAGVLGLVSGRAVPVEDSYHFGYMVGIDISSLADKDLDGKAITDPTTGKYTLIRNGKDIETFENTMVHEHFHALMFDYNRVGMTGSVKMSDFVVKPDGNFFSEEQEDNYYFTKLPTWFTEGAASSVENIFAFRQINYVVLRFKDGKLQSSFDIPTLVYNYIDGKTSEGTPYYHDLWYANGYDENDEKIDNESSAYAMGYLATLYLSELQARKNGKTAISGGNDKTFSSEVLRGGLNDILKRLHEGETLDEVIGSISPVVDGKKVYNDATEFQKKFIKGSFKPIDMADGSGTFDEMGDYVNGEGSAPFVVDILNYFERIGNQEGRVNKSANGSILFDFERDFASPLDRTTDDQSEYLKIVEANTAVISTVPDSEALKDGGKSRSGTPGHDSTMPTTKDEHPMVDILETNPAPQPANDNEGSDDLQAASVEEALAPPVLMPFEDAADDVALPIAA